MKKTAALIMTAVIFLVSVISVNAFTIVYDGAVHEYPWDPITLIVDNNIVETREMPPIMLNNRTLVPAREFFEELGATVKWEGASQRVIIEYSGERIILKINSRTVYVGGNSTMISPSDPPPKIINDKTMIPVRFVAEEFGFKVEWLSETMTVKITSPDAKSVPLTNVKFSNGDDADSILIALDEFVNPNIFKLEEPNRLVIDLYGTEATIKDNTVQVNGDAVQTIRYSQHPEKFRIVADLRADCDYEVFKLKSGVEISIIKVGDSGEESTGNNGSEQPPGDDGEIVVVVDAGHGGTDPGAIYPTGSSKPQAREKDVTLAIALKVRDNLKKNGISVIMTRDSDVYPTLQERVDIANSANADLFVSVHVNAMDNKDEVDGAQVYYHESSSAGKKLAKLIYENIISYTPLTPREVQNGSSFYVLKKTKMPAILAECGFITNKNDRAYITSEKGQTALAKAISDGVLEALG